MQQAITGQQTLADGTYTVKTVLYKDAACTETSMGNKGMVDSVLTISNNGQNVEFLFKTKRFTYLFMDGWLSSMSLDNVSGTHEMKKVDGIEYHNFKFTNTLPLSFFEVGKVSSGQFSMNIITDDNPKVKTGYLKITDITRNN